MTLTWYNEKAEIHGHWEVSCGSWPSKQLSAVLTDHSSGLTAWFAMSCFTCWNILNITYCHSLLGTMGIPYLYAQTTYCFFSNIYVYLYQEAVTTVLIWPLKSSYVFMMDFEFYTNFSRRL